MFWENDTTLNTSNWTKISLKGDAYVLKRDAFVITEHYLQNGDIFFSSIKPNLKYYVKSFVALLGDGSLKFKFKRVDGYSVSSLDIETLTKNTTIVKSGRA